MRQYDKDSTQSWAGLARGGVMGGLVGGIVMAMIMMVITAVKGMGFLTPLYMIAATFHQPWAMAQGLRIVPLLVGAMFHMFNSAIYGLIFALLLGVVARGSGLGTTVWVIAGMVWGLVLLVINQFLILPIVDPAMTKAISSMMVWEVLLHLMYGLVLGALAAAWGGATAGAVTRPTSRQPV